MLINKDIFIKGEKCLLVPYLERHVARYNEWMQDPNIREATASEPLSLEEEYEMQQNWRKDEDKLTFIILDSSLPGASGCPGEDLDLAGPMAGDVNIFLTPPDDESGAEESEQHQPQQQRQQCAANEGLQGAGTPTQAAIAEVEIMVAELGSRRKGIAREAVSLMMAYAAQELGTTKFRAKILESNFSSLALFKQLGFVQTKTVPIFSEVHLELDASKGTDAWSYLHKSDRLQVHPLQV